MVFMTPDSLTCRIHPPLSTWVGNVCYNDGHVAQHDTFTPAGLSFERDGQRVLDNLFAFDDGVGGRDAILTFTKEMTEDGPVVQHD
jgi:prepilin-type processing-associated H-X9-DG protein